MDLSPQQCLDMYRRMVTIRTFDEAMETAYKRGEFWGPTHSSAGEEAVDVGTCAALEPDDAVLGYHRSHGLFIAKGADINRLMAELFGKVTGISRGKGGSMHVADRSVGGVSSSGVLASQMPVAVGVALALQKDRHGRVCVVAIGDGSFEQGHVGEAMNLASLWKVPLIILLYNNKYFQVIGTGSRTSATLLSDRAIGYNIPRAVVDGQDVVEVHRTVSDAVHRARRGEGPTLIEAMTYRYQAQAGKPGPGAEDFRPKSEREYWFNRDPIKLFGARLVVDKIATQGDLDPIDQEAKRAVGEALKFARESPYPDASELFAHTYSRPVAPAWYRQS